jgi:Flp pilus assembly protein TadG
MKNRIVYKNQSGATIVEFALVLPVLILVLLAVIEFGLYFFKAQLAQRTLNNLTSSTQMNPLDATLRTAALNSGMGLVDFSATGNYVCANSYIDEASARTGLCGSTATFNTAPPAGMAVNGSYYVATVAYAKNTPISSLVGKYVPDITSKAVFKVDTVNAAAAQKTTVQSCNGSNQLLKTDANGNMICSTINISSAPPTCTGAGATLQSDGTNYVCHVKSVTVPRCSGATKILQYDGVNYSCITRDENFGGAYSTGTGDYGGCIYKNPATNACSCPAGYTRKRYGAFNGAGSPWYNANVTLEQCVKSTPGFVVN